MNTARTLVMLAAVALAPVPVLTLTGCSGDAAVSTGGDIDAARARELGAVAKRIQADPTAADATLKQAGLTRAQFEAALYVIASDPALSKAYASAL